MLELNIRTGAGGRGGEEERGENDFLLRQLLPLRFDHHSRSCRRRSLLTAAQFFFVFVSLRRICGKQGVLVQANGRYTYHSSINSGQLQRSEHVGKASMFFFV